ncbi:hypothetical protein BEWA_049510 [Theileria equi strain WA]|uniref:Uncharacterized protein n=1 Tax=Theileria equi strain WA TaxID=1537102 RepID=L1LB38_THEEQ|nr:hypothetical protein BEWA_049510 [Theileria equi strain WA]EKX72484.1 hypothetical protein BEWA_049510 [Theileria equi strain WA]|eukprot:XP_004831936.1 hypothetical protein BEWA_049510 [Theileria equi strain WA]
MTDEGVTIDLSQKPTTDGDPGQTYTGDNHVKIKVRRSFCPPDQGLAANFFKYIHILETGGEFILKEIQNNTPISIIHDIKNVTSVSAYYWKHEEGGPKTSLLVEVIQNSGKGGTKYYANIKDSSVNKWTQLPGPQGPPLTNNDFERTLNDLVCSNFDAVTMDISHNASFAVWNSKKPYCCRCNKHSLIERKITVTKNSVPASPQIEYYKHDISVGNSRLAGINYYPKGTNASTPSKRRRIKSTELNFPMTSVQAVYVFCCDRNPVLIYIEGGNPAKGWYKKPSSDNTEWTRVQGISKDPDNIKDCNNEDFKKLVEELRLFGCQNLKTCNKPTQSSHTGPGAASLPGPAEGAAGPKAVGAPGKDGPPGGNGLIGPNVEGDPDGLGRGSDGKSDSSDSSDSKADTTQGGVASDGDGTGSTQSSPQLYDPPGPTAPDSPKAAEFGTGAAEAPVIATIGYFFATSAGSGLTGFLGYKGYKLYQSFKGDPWVRQI